MILHAEERQDIVIPIRQSALLHISRLGKVTITVLKQKHSVIIQTAITPWPVLGFVRGRLFLVMLSVHATIPVTALMTSVMVIPKCISARIQRIISWYACYHVPLPRARTFLIVLPEERSIAKCCFPFCVSLPVTRNPPLIDRRTFGSPVVNGYFRESIIPTRFPPVRFSPPAGSA